MRVDALDRLSDVVAGGVREEGDDGLLIVLIGRVRRDDRRGRLRAGRGAAGSRGPERVGSENAAPRCGS